LIGKPNVGKSSLLNALAGRERSIISPVAGTTRDVLSAILQTKTGAVRLLDVPGDEVPSDELRAKMMEARRLALLDADLVILVVDPTQPHSRECEEWSDLPPNRITIENKADLLPFGDKEEGEWLPGTGKPWGRVSALTGYNIPKLASVIGRLTQRCAPVTQGSIVLNQRHRLILQDAKLAIWQAAGYTRDREAFSRHPEFLASDLRRALDLLGQITGAISPDEVLGRIFSRFCIGK
jgi:tRNA modification GTPase